MAKYYCGPKSWPKFMRKRLSRYFNSQCKLHDDDYQTRLKSRKKIDDDFLLRMLKAAGSDKKKIKQAKFLYFFVRKFGWVFWLKKKGGQLDAKNKK